MVIPKRHGYIVNVLGAKEAEIGLATTVQVVAQGMILNDDNPGLAIHLPFDKKSGQHELLIRFLELELAVKLKEQDYKGIPCYFATFGTDIDHADRVILQVLVQLYGYKPSAEFACEVYDEGPLSRTRNLRAPPGGGYPPDERV